MTAFTTHFAFEFKTGLRNRAQLLINYLFPLGFYALMGGVMTQINPGFAETMMPAMVIFAVTCSTILGLPNTLVEARESGVFRSFKVNGVPALSILAIPMLTALFHALIVSTIIALTAPALFGGVAPAGWPAFALITLITAFAMAAISALIGVISANTQATVLWSQLVFLPSMLIGGLMMPLSLLPASIRPVSALLPTAHAMQAFTGLAYGWETVFNPWASLLALLASGLIALALAIYLFSWDARSQSRRGSPALALLIVIPYLFVLLIR